MISLVWAALLFEVPRERVGGFRSGKEIFLSRCEMMTFILTLSRKEMPMLSLTSERVLIAVALGSF